MDSLLLHCRQGFEPEVCVELTERATSLGIQGYASAKPGSAHAQFVCYDASDSARLMRAVAFASLIFSRQWSRGRFIDLPEKNRIPTLLDCLHNYPVAGSLCLETVDTNEGKALSAFCRKFEKPLRQALVKEGRLVDHPARPRLVLTFLSGQRVFVGLAEPENSSPWPMGIPRLKRPRSAPSRSTLKLEEAWHHFVPRREWESRLAPGMIAVDLGAAPGGWTWQLVQRHIRVTAVDNGPMNGELMETGLVEHLRADGFTYQPRKTVDWMVCDIVEKPARTAALVEQWLVNDWCREAVVNLKLPMKQRYAEVRRLLGRIESVLCEAGRPFRVSCRQLYHDREEVTCHFAAIQTTTSDYGGGRQTTMVEAGKGQGRRR